MSAQECQASACERWSDYGEIDPEGRQQIAASCQRMGQCALGELRRLAQELPVPPMPQLDMERMFGGEK